jgi:thioredoxin 1
MKAIQFCFALVALISIPVFAHAKPPQPFDTATFNALTTGGSPVVVAVHAAWCPTCKAQVPIQTELMKSPEFKTYTLMIVDFDKDFEVMKRFRVLKQSTMIVFRGKTEVGRSIGDTQRESIRALMLLAGGND